MEVEIFINGLTKIALKKAEHEANFCQNSLILTMKSSNLLCL